MRGILPQNMPLRWRVVYSDRRTVGAAFRSAPRPAMQLGIRVQRRSAVRNLPRAKMQTPDTMNSTSPTRKIRPDIARDIWLAFPVDNDGNTRGVSDLPGRPRGG